MALKETKTRLGVRYTIMILLSLIFIFPVVFMIVSSLKPSLQLLSDSSSLKAFLPVGDISLQNYINAFKRVPVARFIFNSIFVTGITVVLGLIVNSLAGFSLAVLKWKRKGIVLGIIIATMVLPFETIAIPLLLLVSRLPTITLEGIKLGWINTYHVQIIPFIAHAFSIFLFTQFFKSIPKELVESSKIDGATWFQIYRKIYVPISGPVFSTAAILTLLPMWNQYLWPIMVVQSEEIRPVMVGLQYFFQLNVEWGDVMAFLTMITIPVLVLFLFLQKTYIESIASSGIKG